MKRQSSDVKEKKLKASEILVTVTILLLGQKTPNIQLVTFELIFTKIIKLFCFKKNSGHSGFSLLGTCPQPYVGDHIFISKCCSFFCIGHSEIKSLLGIFTPNVQLVTT